jgi:hypothetical protein
MHKLHKTCISDQNMHSIVIALTLQICIYMQYKSSPNEPLLCGSFAPNFREGIQNRPNMYLLMMSIG